MQSGLKKAENCFGCCVVQRREPKFDEIGGSLVPAIES